MAEQAQSAQPKPTITFDEFARADLRAATVLECEPHPNADRLLKLQVDLGPMGRRQICAGIRPYYEPGELVGKQIAVVANLEPRTIRGEESKGMLLAGSKEYDGELEDIILLTLGREIPPGAKIS